jgi:hypothetical protein
MNKQPIIKYQQFPLPLLIGLFCSIMFLVIGLDESEEKWNLAILCAILCSVIPFAKTRMSLIIYDDYIEGKKGFLKTISLSSPMNSIDSIYLEETFIGKILGYQTIVIRSFTGIHYFKWAKNGKEIHNVVLQKIIEKNK